MTQKYIKEIDGIRGLAIIFVILSHTGISSFSGGFIGVDIFFVISGYLITKIIISELNNNNFSIKDFYFRRAKRILPSLCICLLICLPFSIILINPKELIIFTNNLLGVLTFSSNIILWREAGYFQIQSNLNPLLHTWSLGVEEQFYFFFPILLIIAFRKNKFKFLLFTIILISLILSEIGSLNFSSANFYLLPTRIWELMLGGLIVERNKTIKIEHSKIIKELECSLGIILIIGSLIYFGPNSKHPSILTLIPVMGTLILLKNIEEITTVNKILRIQLLVKIGLISYSLYLYHQPVFAFSANYFINSDDSKIIILAVLITIVLSIINYKYVELKFKKNNNNKLFIYTVTLSYIVLINFIIIVKINNGFEGRYKIPDLIHESLKTDDYSTEVKCRNDKNKYDIYLKDFCIIENNYSTKKVALFGDSHLSSLKNIFINASTKKNIELIINELAGCPPLLDVEVIGSKNNWGECKEINDLRYSYVKENKIEKIYLISRWSTYTHGDYNGSGLRSLVGEKNDNRTLESSRKKFEKSLQNTINKYNEIGVKVVVVLQVPEHKNNARILYYKIYSKIFNIDKLEAINNSSINYELHKKIQLFNRQIFNKQTSLNFKILNLDHNYCNLIKCFIGDELGAYYVDNNHLSNYGASKNYVDIFLDI